MTDLRRTSKIKRNWIFCIVVGLLAIGLGFVPSDTMDLGAGAIPRANVRILSVDNSNLAPLGIVYSGVQFCEVEVLNGPHKGETGQAVNHLNSALDKDKLFEVGDRALAMVHDKEGGMGMVTLIDHDRVGIEALLLALFGVLIIIFGGVSGLGALVALVASIMIIWKILVPLMLMGFSPILVSFLVVVVLTVLIDLLVAGLTRTAVVAILGSLLGTGLTCAASILFGNALKLDGSNLPYVVPLIAQNQLQLNLRDIFFSMVFIANSGALMDLAIDIAAACEEVEWHKPDITPKEMLVSAFSVGKKVIGTMTTTLMLAYSGSYLSLLMYFMGQGTPIIDMLNLKYVASEILTTLVGSFGLVAVAPFTAIMAALAIKYKKKSVRAERAA